MNNHGKYSCACCGFFTLKEMKETCPVCFWEEDFFQEKNIDDNGGPNSLSLRVAKENFKKIGVMDEQFRHLVRSPNKDELS